MLRDFTIADLSSLNSVRQQALFLQNQIVLTQGSGVMLRGAVLSPLASFTGVFTMVCENREGGQALVGQVQHPAGSMLAYCTFLAPHTALNSAAVSELIESLLKKVGARGAQGLLAELDEHNAGFEALRQAGFSIYARQRIWKLDKKSQPSSAESAWRPVFDRDEFAIQLLRGNLLPGQVQQAEAMESSKLDGYVYYRNGQLLAYVEVRRGPRGIWLQPFVHLDAEPFNEIFLDLLNRLHPRSSRPLYVSVRSYQDWLEKTLEELGAQPGPRQVAMARRTVVPLKVEKAQRAVPTAQRIEPTTPIHAPVPTRRHEPEWMTYDQTPNYR